MYVVTYQKSPADPKFWLRGTVWTFSQDRATQHETHEAAAQAVKASATFNPKAARAAKIEELS